MFKRIIKNISNKDGRFEKYFNDAPYGVFIVDEMGYYLDVNKEACKMSGYGKKELIGKKLLDWTCDEDKEKANQGFSNLIKS